MFNGTGVAIVTPFKNGEVDIDALRKLIDFHLENHTQALIVLGTTGEASTQSIEERKLVIKTAVANAKGKIPIIIGTGSNNTATAVKYTEQAEELGADGILLTTPYYNKCTQKGLIAHLTTVANATTLPVILYNVPSRTGVNIPAEVVAKMAELDNVVGMKEASGDMGQILDIKRLTPPGFKIYSGNDDQVIPIYACGGHGVISVAGNIMPRVMQSICAAFMEGKVEEAISLQLKYKKCIDLLFSEVNPIPVKAALNEMGYIEDELRLPLTSMEAVNREKLVEEMKKLQII
ncbi:dihydrodipicolinate synthase [Alkaliphilus metalliredigens QYMF]|uniref:4-hydroxy-tetrahydrodipicolinate synthase n=1 Tax=Alkaliphilus metalliredigens (strain QYMF) TaxID=293826 RepID=A6TT17_ALKMQ|nr:4-hydroxy-tetrahydrodipicolinate synthase [Alkaliphilus metalliredigens]ABR49335.1 dihydrodipicolinate synthase [Alkaliphilus metalliredigens QYMF]